MAQTVIGGVTVDAGVPEEIEANALADILIVNPTNHVVYLFLGDAAVSGDSEGGIRLGPGDYWLRNDTENVPVLQGKITVKSGNKAVLSVTRV